MKQLSTLFLKTAVLLIGGTVFALCVLLLFQLFTQRLGGYFPIVIGMLIASIPFFVGGYQTLKLLGYIDSNRTFSPVSITALQTIKYCAILISSLYAIGMPYIFYVADKDDAPGVVLLGLIFTFAPMIIAVFAAVLEKLLQTAIEVKSENDLTV